MYLYKLHIVILFHFVLRLDKKMKFSILLRYFATMKWHSKIIYMFKQTATFTGLLEYMLKKKENTRRGIKYEGWGKGGWGVVLLTNLATN